MVTAWSCVDRWTVRPPTGSGKLAEPLTNPCRGLRMAFQRCLFRVRTALMMTAMWLG